MNLDTIIGWTAIAAAAGGIYGVLVRRRFDTALWAILALALIVGALLVGVASLKGGVHR